jgi:hypothetical protein
MRTGSSPGPFQDGLKEAMRTTRAAAVFVGAHGTGSWQQVEIRAFLNQMVRRRLPVIPVVGELTGTLQPIPTNGSRPKNPAAVALGKLGGSKGGTIRAARLTPEQRSEIAQKAARARWKKEGE